MKALIGLKSEIEDFYKVKFCFNNKTILLYPHFKNDKSIKYNDLKFEKN